MTSDYGVAVRPGGPPATAEPARSLRQWWIAITTLLMATILVEAVFAGAILSGAGWARAAHAITALMLAASSLIAGLVASATLRRVPNGARLGWILLAMAALIVVQAVSGASVAKGVNLLWLHVPLGVALVGLAGQTVASARRLGQRSAG